MTRPFTVQCTYAGYWAHIVTVEAKTLDAALAQAIETANASDAWRALDHCGATFVDAVVEGADADPWDPEAALPIPDRFTERGAPPVVTLAGPGRPGRIEVAGGAVRLRFVDAAGTVTTEVSDSAPADNTPIITVRRRADGRPDVTVTEGRARIRILDD